MFSSAEFSESRGRVGAPPAQNSNQRTTPRNAERKKKKGREKKKTGVTRSISDSLFFLPTSFLNAALHHGRPRPPTKMVAILVALKASSSRCRLPRPGPPLFGPCSAQELARLGHAYRSGTVEETACGSRGWKCERWLESLGLAACEGG